VTPKLKEPLKFKARNKSMSERINEKEKFGLKITLKKKPKKLTLTELLMK
jgi:hypothetical protein